MFGWRPDVYSQGKAARCCIVLELKIKLVARCIDAARQLGHFVFYDPREEYSHRTSSLAGCVRGC